jgi:hypothetical protein
MWCLFPHGFRPVFAATVCPEQKMPEASQDGLAIGGFAIIDLLGNRFSIPVKNRVRTWATQARDPYP